MGEECQNRQALLGGNEASSGSRATDMADSGPPPPCFLTLLACSDSITKLQRMSPSD